MHLISSLPAAKQVMVRQALDALFKKKFFSICTLDAILTTLDKPQKGKAYEMLRALHCVNYNEMSEEAKQLIPALINELLAPPAQCIATDEALAGVKFE